MLFLLLDWTEIQTKILKETFKYQIAKYFLLSNFLDSIFQGFFVTISLSEESVDSWKYEK